MVRHLIRLALLVPLLLGAIPALAAYPGPVIFNTGACLTGGPVPPTPRTVEGMFPVNLQTGTSYAIVANDKCKFIKFSNAAALSITLPGTVLPSGWMAFVEDRGAGGGTITPGAGQIEGGSSYSLAQNNPAIIFSDGSNYHVFSFTAGAGGATTITINSITCTLGSSCTIPTGGAPSTCSNTGDYACLNLDEVWAARQQVPCTVLTDGSTVSVTASAKNAFCLTLTGNSHTLSNPTGLQAGTYIFVIDLNGHTGFATDTEYKYPGGSAPAWAGINLLVCYADGTSRLLCSAGVGMS